MILTNPDRQREALADDAPRRQQGFGKAQA